MNWRIKGVVHYDILLTFQRDVGHLQLLRWEPLIRLGLSTPDLLTFYIPSQSEYFQKAQQARFASTSWLHILKTSLPYIKPKPLEYH